MPPSSWAGDPLSRQRRLAYQHTRTHIRGLRRKSPIEGEPSAYIRHRVLLRSLHRSSGGFKVQGILVSLSRIYTSHTVRYSHLEYSTRCNANVDT